MTTATNTRTVTKALTEFFNTGEGKRPTSAWAGELKALSSAEKTELATLACAASGWTLVSA